jgi:hypothetical protein
MLQHTEQGFNTGKPPYGYQVAIERHPVPAKTALRQGQTAPRKG